MLPTAWRWQAHAGAANLQQESVYPAHSHTLALRGRDHRADGRGEHDRRPQRQRGRERGSPGTATAAEGTGAQRRPYVPRHPEAARDAR